MVQAGEATDRQIEGLAALLEAVREARTIRSRAAAASQRQYIGKLMRHIDTEPIRVAVAAGSETGARKVAQQVEKIVLREHRVELLDIVVEITASQPA